MNDRPYDVVMFGATGFTGALTAQYLVENAGEARVALAGRNREKLEKLDTGLPLLHADVEEPDSLREMAEAARVVITTVGPYIKYGEPLVAACTEAGTDCVDSSPGWRPYWLSHSRPAAWPGSGTTRPKRRTA